MFLSAAADFWWNQEYLIPPFLFIKNKAGDLYFKN